MDYRLKKYLLYLTSILIIVFIIQEYRLHSQRSKQDLLAKDLQSMQQKLDIIESMDKQNFVNAQKIPLPVVFCGDTLDMKNPYIRERVEREFYSLLGNQGQLQLYLKRTDKYLPMIEQYLNDAGLPEDIKYLSVHESALLPKIRSRSNAVGLWQFMYSTGRLYKLKINRYIDERRDPEKATAAATRFLKDLYKRFKDWPLVLAAYNGGQGRIQRNIKKQNTRSLIDLSLPQETERYYFKIVATKIIVSQPKAFGFRVEKGDFFTAPKTVDVDFTIQKDKMFLKEIASTFNMSIVALKETNPHLINTHLNRGTYELNIPVENHQWYFENDVSESLGEESLAVKPLPEIYTKDSFQQNKSIIQ